MQLNVLLSTFLLLLWVDITDGKLNIVCILCVIIIAEFIFCIANYLLNGIFIMLFYPTTIARKYFVKTQTYVALFGPHELSLIFQVACVWKNIL